MVNLVRVLPLAGIFLALNLSSMWFSNGPESLAIFWPGNGYLLAVLLLVRAPWRPPLLGLASLIFLAINLVHGKDLPTSLAFSAANLLEIGLAFLLMRGVSGGDRFLGDQAGILQFFGRVTLGAAGAGALAGAGAASLLLGHRFLPTAATWFLVDAASLAVVTPVVLSWARGGFGWPAGWRRNVEFAICAIATCAIAWIVFRRPEHLWADAGHPMSYMIFPLLIWSAIRFGARGASTTVLLNYAIMAWNTSRGQGPFAAGEGGVLHIPMHLFPFASAICSLLPAMLFHSRGKVEGDLRFRERRFGSLWNSRLIGIYASDIGGIVREANDTFLSMVRHSRSEMEAGEIRMLKMATPEYLAQAAENRERFEKDGQIGPLEREWILKDGSRFHSLVYASRDEGSNFALGMVMNMEELHSTQLELRRRESRYRDLLSSTLIGIFVSDLEGRIIEANDTFLNLIRRTREDLDAGRIHSGPMATPEYLAGAAERQAHFRKEGRMGPYDREWLLADGSRINTLFFATRIEEDGNALCMVLDREELQQTRTELRAVETRFKKLSESNIVGVAVVEGRRFKEANDTFLQMVGYDRSDLESGRLTADAIRNPDEAAAGPAVEAIIQAAGRLDPQETEYVRKDGSKVNVFRGVTKLDESGLFLVIAIDISELKRTQAELEKAMSTARTADRAKTDFLAHMSHEIRTPMNGILGMVSLLQGTRLDEEQQSYARACRESGEHLLGLINQILDFSKIESGTLELDRSEFSLANLVEGVLSPLLEKAQGKGLELVKRLDPALPPRFLGDPMRLQQILLNLAGNAVKFSDRGEVRVSANLLSRKEGLCRIGFEIEDHGPGIRPETLATLFRPFRQGDERLSRRAGGTGLGLAISKELVSRMGGTIVAESRPGEGSVFRFDVLLEEAETLGTGGPNAVAVDPAHSAWILEPHPDHRAQLEQFLGTWGIRVRAAEDEEDLLRGIAEEDSHGRPASLVVLSANVKAGQFPETLRTLESLRNHRVPVLCSLPFITQSEGVGLIKAGASGILTKPFRGSDIFNALRSILPDWTGIPDSRERLETVAGPAAWATPPLVLVVDDHPVNLTVASSILRKLGCRVETVADGPSALSILSRHPVDLVFMDCQMPDMDGFETTRLIRAYPGGKSRVPVVALTAHAVKGFREKCLSEGMDDYISKPFTMFEIAASLRKWVQGRPAPVDREGGVVEAGTAGEPASGAPCVDWNRMSMMDDGTPQGKESLRKLVDLFLETSRAGLESIRKAAGEVRKPELAKALHKLKGGCGTIGATGMYAVVRDLEAGLKDFPAAEFDAGLGRLEAEFARTRETLKSRS